VSKAGAGKRNDEQFVAELVFYSADEYDYSLVSTAQQAAVFFLSDTRF